MDIYLTIAELAGMVKLSEQTIRRYVLNRAIPYRKIRKAVRFRLSEIEKWIDGGCASDSSAGGCSAGQGLRKPIAAYSGKLRAPQTLAGVLRKPAAAMGRKNRRMASAEKLENLAVWLVPVCSGCPDDEGMRQTSKKNKGL